MMYFDNYYSKFLLVVSFLWIFALNVNPLNAQSDEEKTNVTLSNNSTDHHHQHHHHLEPNIKSGVVLKRTKRIPLRSNPFIGTNWCQDVTPGSQYPDGVGLYFRTDECCKSHVQCTNNDRYEMETTFGIRLNDPFRSCKCDFDFYQCLQNVQKIVFKSNAVGAQYFDKMAPKCVIYSYPVDNCVDQSSKYSPVLKQTITRCDAYHVDSSQSPKLQLLDNPFYTEREAFIHIISD